MLDLPTEPASVVLHHEIETQPLAVDEADDPLVESWPFLLIDRTSRIFTVHVWTLRSRCDTNEYHRIHGVSSI